MSLKRVWCYRRTRLGVAWSRAKRSLESIRLQQTAKKAVKSGRPDLNWGPLGPEPSALPGYATPRKNQVTGNRRQVTVMKKGADCSLSPVTCSLNWSGRPDLNWRPLAPQASALPGCATSRKQQGRGNSRQVTAGICSLASARCSLHDAITCAKALSRWTGVRGEWHGGVTDQEPTGREDVVARCGLWSRWPEIFAPRRL